MKANQWDKYADLYNKGIGLAGDSLHVKFIDPLIRKYIYSKFNKLIVDIGCGNGYLLRKLSNYAEKVIGIDSSIKLLQYAKINTKPYSNIQLIQADISKTIPLDNDACNIVITNMVLQYLPKLAFFAKEVHRILKPDGIFVTIIDHPCHSLFLRAQELLGKKDSKFITTGSYFFEELRLKKSLWDKAKLEYYHRPIMKYINTFSPFFKLDKIDELTENNEMPRILGMKWIKP